MGGRKKSGINSWGGYCPPHLSFNSTRKRKGLCTDYEFHLYRSWCAHGEQGYIKSGNPWINFGTFYEWAKQQPLWDQFKIDHRHYCFEKDRLGYQLGLSEFSPRTVRLTTTRDNIEEMHSRCDSQKVRAVSESVVKEFDSLNECARVLGTSHAYIAKIHDTGIEGKGSALGWKFYYI